MVAERSTEAEPCTGAEPCIAAPLFTEEEPTSAIAKAVVGGDSPDHAAANELVRDIHDRMLVIIPRGLRALGLDQRADRRELLVPYPADPMRIWPNRPGSTSLNDAEQLLDDVGALLANLLVALGLSFLLGGLRHHDQEYNPHAVRAFSSIMVLAWISLALPSAFHRALGPEQYQAQHATLDLVVAVVLLGLYGLFLLYSLRITHPETFAELSLPAPRGEAGAHPGIGRGIATLLFASLGAAWMSEILVGAAEQAGEALGMSQMFMGVIVLALVGGAAESGSAIAMGRANRVDLSVGIALGSCVQIALFVAPLLVLSAPLIAQSQFQLVFSQAEMWMLFGAVLLGATVATTGHSTGSRAPNCSLSTSSSRPCCI